MQIHLQVTDLSVAYNGTNALEHISFSASGGERIAVVGPNGAGKSTLFKALTGLLPLKAGCVETFGSRLGYVNQRSMVDLKFPVTVYDVVMMGRTVKIGWLRWPGRQDREIILSSLEQVGMLDFARRQIGGLSGGQQQRVFIARTLAQEADILLMDEPFSGVDVPSMEAILTLLDTLSQRGVMVIVSTHDLNLAVERFDRLMLLNRSLIAYGDPHKVITPEVLSQAYGGKAVWRGEGYAMVLGDIDCCGGEGHHHD